MLNIEASGLRVPGFRASCVGVQVSDFQGSGLKWESLWAQWAQEFRVSGFGSRVSGFEVSGFGFRGFGFRGFGFRVFGFWV